MRRNKAFTLLEITLTIAVLAVIAAILSWQIKNMVATQHFQKNCSMLYTDLQKMEILALTHRADIEMRIVKKGEGYAYQIFSDEPIMHLSKEVLLMGVKKIRWGDVSDMKLWVTPSGWIRPNQKLFLFQDIKEKKGAIINFEHPPFIELKELKSLT